MYPIPPSVITNWTLGKRRGRVPNSMSVIVSMPTTDDAVGAEVVGAGRRVVTPGNEVGEAHRVGAPVLWILAGDGVESHRRRALILIHPELAPVGIDDVGAGPLKLLWKSFGPYVGRLDDVVVDAE